MRNINNENNFNDFNKNNLDEELDNSEENANDIDSDSSRNYNDITESDESSDDNNGFFSSIMFPSSNLSVHDVILMITAFSVRYHISDEARTELGNMIKTFAGPLFSSLSLNKHTMSKFFHKQQQSIQYHFFCPECQEKIIHSTNASGKKNCSSDCSNCKKKTTILSNSSNYFLSINLEYQVKQLLANKIFTNNIIKNITSRFPQKNACSITDVHDGELYRQIYQSNCSYKNNSEFILTFNFSHTVDGAPLTKSGKRGFWPCQLTMI